MARGKSKKVVTRGPTSTRKVVFSMQLTPREMRRLKRRAKKRGFRHVSQYARARFGLPQTRVGRPAKTPAVQAA